MAFEEIASLTWKDANYSHSISVNARGVGGQLNNGKWWWLFVTCGGGFTIGVLKVLFSKVVAPYPLHPPSLFTEVKDLQCSRPLESLCTLAISAVSMGCGASVGPEAAISGVGGALGTLLGRFGHPLYRRRCRTHPAALSSTRLVPLYSLTGMAAAFGPLLPSPYLAVLLLHELSVVGGSFGAFGRISVMEEAVHTGVAATASYALFVSVKEQSFLAQHFSIPPAELLVEHGIAATSVTSWMRYVALAVPLGVACGAFATLGVIALGIGRKLGTFTHRAISAIGGRSLGLLLTPVVGGGLLGLLAVGCPLTLGEGTAQLGPVVVAAFRNANGTAIERHVSTLDPPTLIATAAAKMLALGLSIGFGFVGGQIFPLIFAGACVGAAAHQLLPTLPVVVVVPCCIAGVPAAITPAPLAMVSLVCVMLTLGGDGAAPIFVTTLVSYTTVCGMGVLQTALERMLRRTAAPDTTLQPDTPNPRRVLSSRASSFATAFSSISTRAEEELGVAPLTAAAAAAQSPAAPCAPSANAIATTSVTANASDHDDALAVALPEPLNSHLAGTYLCTCVEGDLGRQMALLGLPWLKRKAGAALQWGVGTAVMVVGVEGIHLSVEIKGRVSAHFIVDGSEQEMELPDGSKARTVVRLEGSTIVMHVPSRDLVTRRYLENDTRDAGQMKQIVEMTCKGVTSRRVFTRREE